MLSVTEARLFLRRDRRLRAALLEHFPAKWMPVRVEKMRQIKKLEPFPYSIEAGNAIERDAKKWIPVFRKIPL